MVTVHRAFEFRFVIFSNDHSPPHVHVVGQGGEAKIAIEGPGGPALEWAVGIGAGDLRRLLRETEAQAPQLNEAWRRMHG